MILLYLRRKRNHLQENCCMRLICAFETNFFISKVGIIALDGGGFEQGVQRIRRTLAPLFSSVFCLIISELLGEFFLRIKREWSLKLAKTESVPLSLVMQNAILTRIIRSKTAQMEKVFFNHSMHHNVPSKEKKSVIMFKCSNCTEVKWVPLLFVHLSRAFSSWKTTSFSRFYFDKLPQDGRKQ